MYPRRLFPARRRARGSNNPGPGHGRSGNHERPRGTSRQRYSDRMDHRASQTGLDLGSRKERDEFLASLLCCPNLPPLRVPEELRYEEVALPAHPHLTISKTRVPYRHERLDAKLCFAYEGRMFAAFDPARGFFDAAGRRFIRRDSNAEKAAWAFLDQLGLKQRAPTYPDSTPRWELAPSKLPRIVRSLVEAGWDIEAEGKIFRRPGPFRIEVSSGVDWFELHGEVEYGNTTARLPELLEIGRAHV